MIIDISPKTVDMLSTHNYFLKRTGLPPRSFGNMPVHIFGLIKAAPFALLDLYSSYKCFFLKAGIPAIKDPHLPASNYRIPCCRKAWTIVLQIVVRIIAIHPDGVPIFRKKPPGLLLNSLRGILTQILPIKLNSLALCPNLFHKVRCISDLQNEEASGSSDGHPQNYLNKPQYGPKTIQYCYHQPFQWSQGTFCLTSKIG